MDELKLRKQAQRKTQAESLLKNELFNESFGLIENEIIEAWKSKDNDERVRENAYIMYRLLQNLKQQFQNAINSGKIAEKDLLQLKEKKSFFSKSQP